MVFVRALVRMQVHVLARVGGMADWDAGGGGGYHTESKEPKMEDGRQILPLYATTLRTRHWARCLGFDYSTV
jgi:hypothetical protein